MPDSLAKAFGGHCFDNEVWGLFTVCPYEKDRPGAMRMVHIQAAKILSVRGWNESHPDARGGQARSVTSAAK